MVRATEETHLDDSGLPLVDLRQPVQRFVERDQIDLGDPSLGRRRR